MPIVGDIVKSRTYTTAEVAAACGVDKSTLLRWLYAGKLEEPARETRQHVEVRVWTAQDLERAKRYRAQRYRRRA
jgi:predicted site-specific integrase-resolvase